MCSIFLKILSDLLHVSVLLLRVVSSELRDVGRRCFTHHRPEG